MISPPFLIRDRYTTLPALKGRVPSYGVIDGSCAMPKNLKQRQYKGKGVLVQEGWMKSSSLHRRAVSTLPAPRNVFRDVSLEDGVRCVGQRDGKLVLLDAEALEGGVGEVDVCGRLWNAVICLR